MSLSHDDDYNFLPEIKSFLSTLENQWIVKDLHCDTKGTVVNLID